MIPTNWSRFKYCFIQFRCRFTSENVMTAEACRFYKSTRLVTDGLGICH